MSDFLLDVQVTNYQLEITRDSSSVTLETTNQTSVNILEVGIQGPAGPPGAGIGIAEVAQDTSPELGGNLNLNGFTLTNGVVESPDLVLDGGLL